MNPASVMKLVTTYAALELLGRDYRWKTEAYLGGKLDKKGTLNGNLVLKGYGDPKITIEQWQAFMARPAHARAATRSPATSCSTARYFKLPEHDPAAFDQEPLRPYNVGPDALLVNFKAVRFAFAPETGATGVAMRAEPPLPDIALTATAAARQRRLRRLARDARRAVGEPRHASASATFPGRYSQSCGERDWYVALLDHPHYVLGMFTAYFREKGGQFDGGVVEGRAAAQRDAVRGDGVGAAVRHRARREQALEQRDGAADLPHARDDAPPAARHARARVRRRSTSG